MTECERLINEGIFDASFFKEEVKNDFLITSDRKKLWAILIDIVLQIDKVCKKYNITYYLMYGSILGAIRHGGFIPWDDDIDLTMPRDDYEKFIKLSHEFKDPYFLQTPYTDKEYVFSFARVRNSKTTSYSEVFKYQKMNHGIFVAIFPLDNCLLTEDSCIYERNKKLARMNSAYMRRNYPCLSDSDKERVLEFSNNNPLSIYEEIQKNSQVHQHKKTDYLAHLACAIYSYEKQCFHKSDFSKAIIITFEKRFSFPIPIGWKNILKLVYGDYLSMPPIEERGKWHQGTVIDPDVPFIDYLKTH